MTSSSRATTSRAAQLARLGFADAARADQLLDDPALAGLVDPFDDVFGDGVVDALGAVADPDLALLALVRLMEALRRLDDDHQHGVRELVAALRHRGPGQDRLLAVLGSSVALGNHLVGHPDHWTSVTTATRRTAGERTADLVAAVSSQRRGERTAYDALRVAYRRELLGVAALDLTADRAVDELPETAAALADLACAAVEAALAIAREAVGEAADRCRFAVIGMGQCGGRELN